MKDNVNEIYNRQSSKQNMKIYSIYRMISADIIFFYAIDFLFLTQVKNISASDVVLKSSFYALFMIILQIPASIIIDKLGTKKCTVLGNVFNTIYLLIIMCATNLQTLIIAEFISALCFSLKDISDRTLLNMSIPECEKKAEIFSKIEGKADRNYYYINAITSICAGFLYTINPYIPVALAFLISAFATIMSLGFQSVDNNSVIKRESSKQYTINYIKDLKLYFKFIIKSQRLRSLILYSGIVWGTLCLSSTYRTNIFKDVGISAIWIAIVSAVVGIASGIGAKSQLKFHNKFRNKSLSILLTLISSSILFTGLVGITNLPSTIIMILIMIFYIILNSAKGIYGVLITRYLSNFTNDNVLSKIYSVNAISRNIFRMLIGFLGSYLLTITNAAHATILLGIMFIIISLSLISYMKTRTGLKPEQYKKEEIEFK